MRSIPVSHVDQEVAVVRALAQRVASLERALAAKVIPSDLVTDAELAAISAVLDARVDVLEADEYATDAEVADGVATDRKVSPAGLASLTGDWTRPTMLNGWLDYEPGGAGALTPPRYVSWRIVGDEVQIRGAMRAGTIGSPAFVVPFPPPFRQTFPATGATVASQVVIDTDGTVTPSVGTNPWFFLDAIRYSITP